MPGTCAAMGSRQGIAGLLSASLGPLLVQTLARGLTYNDPSGTTRSGCPARVCKDRVAFGKRCTIASEYLLHRASTGDSGAIQELIARFGGLVWSLARRLGLPEAETEDAVHEVFTELWRNGSRYDPNIASETAFVATIARRRLIDRRRKLGRQPFKQQLTETEPTREPGQPRNEIGEEAAKASEAFEQLSPEQQRVLRLSVYEGLSHELIARATGLPLGTVKTHARRGLIRLREMLNNQEKKSSNGEAASPEPKHDGAAPPAEGGR